MNEAEKDNKRRDKVIAENESERQTAGDVRVSSWAIVAAVLVGLAVFGWVMLR
jgi:F0F1-type ATP synthase assembly protein I